MTLQRWRTALWMVLLLFLCFVIWRARSALLPFAVGAIFAYVLTPVVDFMVPLLPRRAFTTFARTPQKLELYRRGVAVLLVYAVIAGGLTGTGIAVAPLAADQVVEFVDNLPAIVEDARAQTTEWLAEYHERVPVDVQKRVDRYAGDATAALSDWINETVQSSLGLLGSTLGLLFGLLIVPIWLFYALRDRYNVERNFMNAVPERFRDDVRHVMVMGDRILLRYVRGQLLLGLIVGVAVGVGLTLMDVPLALALGVFAGVTEMIPIIGPWIGSIPGVILVAGTDPDKLLWVTVFYFVVQQLENQILVPRVQGRAVALHPAIIILLLIVGGAAFGFWGLLAIVPLAGIARDLFWYMDRRLSGASPAEAFAPTQAARMQNRSPTLARRAASALRRRLARPARGARHTATRGTTDPGDGEGAA
ncbi:MAG: AI-2E family transporter [Dehalococcoidia bacterium]|nr:AI-2E family transporter [Dehalococcoidia bacterium]